MTASYDPRFFDLLASAETKHFWFRARARAIQGSVRRLSSGLPVRPRILEIGCGSGTVLAALRSACPDATVVGIDIHQEGLAYARRRTDAALVRGRIEQLPFAARFDLIGLFDVLEHLPDDLGALRRVRSVLDSRGALVATVPAHRSLWSRVDEAAGHCRRYEPCEFHKLFEEAGYRIEFATAYMTATFPIVWAVRRLSRPPDDVPLARELRVPTLINAILERVLRVEADWLARGRRLPFGASLFAIARPE